MVKAKVRAKTVKDLQEKIQKIVIEKPPLLIGALNKVSASSLFAVFSKKLR